MNELYVYIHVPFCVKRCLYCDFVSTTRLDLVEGYLRALKEDLRLSGYLQGREIRTVYFGGGTPSIVPQSFIGEILEEIDRIGHLNPVEVTLEANPESLNGEKIREYASMGFNRISLGVQAFDDGVLRKAGRSHDVEDVERSLGLILEHFENVNVDFIIGLPGYTMETVRRNLKLVKRYRPKHVSVYKLELDEGTPLWKMVRSSRLKLPEDEEVDSMLDFMMRGLEDMGYGRYEISNFSLKGFESVHNMSYWRNLDYAGFGVSAGGHLGRFRYVRTLNMREYLKDPLTNSYEMENDDLQEFK